MTKFTEESTGSFGVPNVTLEQSISQSFDPYRGNDFRDELVIKNSCIRIEAMRFPTNIHPYPNGEFVDVPFKDGMFRPISEFPNESAFPNQDNNLLEDCSNIFPNEIAPFHELRAVCADGSTITVGSAHASVPNAGLRIQRNNDVGESEFFFESGVDACMSKNSPNTDLYFASNNDKRQSLGLFFNDDLNITQDNFTDSMSDLLFTQIEKLNLVSNGNSRLVQRANYFVESLGDASFKPQGGWDYLNIDGIGIHISMDENGQPLNVPGISNQRAFIQNQNYSDYYHRGGPYGYAGNAPYAYRGRVPSSYGWESNPSEGGLGFDMEWARWVMSNECFSYGRCLKFSASRAWNDTTDDNIFPYVGSDSDIETPSEYVRVLSLANDNEYRTMNQVQKIYNGASGDKLLNPYSSIDVSFMMKTTKLDVGLQWDDIIEEQKPSVEAVVTKNSYLPSANAAGYNVTHETNVGDYATLFDIGEEHVQTSASFLISGNEQFNHQGHFWIDNIITHSYYSDNNELNSSSPQTLGNYYYNGAYGGGTSLHDRDYTLGSDTCPDGITTCGDSENGMGQYTYERAIKQLWSSDELQEVNIKSIRVLGDWDDVDNVATHIDVGGIRFGVNVGNLTDINNPPLPSVSVRQDFRTIWSAGDGYTMNPTSDTPEFFQSSPLEGVSIFKKTGDGVVYDGLARGRVPWDFGISINQDDNNGIEVGKSTYHYRNRYNDTWAILVELDYRWRNAASGKKFYNKNFLSQTGHYNSIESNIDDYKSILGGVGRFTNNRFNTWEKKSFTFNTHEQHMVSGDIENIKDLSFIIQTSGNEFGGFRGEVYIDDIVVNESYNFTPDVDVRKKIAADEYGAANLTKYYDRILQPDEYKDTTAPLEAQFYFYPRYFYNQIFDIEKPIIHNDFRNGMFYLYNVDWGDGSAKEFVSEPEQLGEDKAIYHTYESSGIFEITGTMIRMKPSKEFKPLGIIHHKKFQLFININEGTDEDFTYFGSEGFSFIPYKNTLPTIGGYSNQSIYYNSVKRQLGIISDDVKVDTVFNSLGDRLKTELALDKMDDTYSDDFIALNAYKESRYNINDTLPSAEVLDTSANFLNSLPFPNYWKEYDITEDGVLGIDDIRVWNSYGRPDIANDLSVRISTGNLPSYSTSNYNLKYFYNPYYSNKELVYLGQETFPNELGRSLGNVDLTEIRFFTEPKNMYLMLGFDEPATDGSLLPNEDAPVPENPQLESWLSVGYIIWELDTIPVNTETIPEGISQINSLSYSAALEGYGVTQTAIFIQGLGWIGALSEIQQNGVYLFMNKTNEDILIGDYTIPPTPATVTHHAGNPDASNYWKKIIPENYSIYNREGLGQDENGNYIIPRELNVVEWGRQTWNQQVDGITPYYPVLPKYGRDGKFLEGSLMGNANQDGVEGRTPFPLNGPITDKNYTDNSLRISINGELKETNVFDDLSGNNNYGFSYNDYKPNFEEETLKPRKVKSAGTVRKSNLNGAF